MLARALGMTVSRLRREVGNREYVQWRAFYRWEQAQRDMAESRAAVSRR